jgi:poly-gamma-glutamate synthesis protein (capsule biosynthesis protein)
MKKINGFMKLLIVLPALLLFILLGWMIMDKLKWSQGAQNAVSTEVVAESAEMNTTSAAVIETTEESIKIQIAESEEGIIIEAETEPIPETEPEDPVVHLLFAGDVLLSNHVISAYDKAGGIHGVLDDGYRQVIDQSDIFMVNQEFPFSDRGTAAPDKQFTFRLPPSRVSAMNELGIDIVALANNHSLDFGTDALVDTCTTLDGADIKYVGAGPNMDRAKQLETIEVNGKTIGFLAASRVYPDTSWVANSKKPGMVSGYDPTILLQEIEKARDVCDYLVVYVHWGIEKDVKPQEYQRVLGKKIIDAGADIVIGSHPHVLQGIEYYNGKPICYSLGNFIFGSSIPKTALLKADVDFSQNNVTLSLVPGTSGAGYTRELTDPGKIQEFYQYIQGLSYDVTVDENGIIHSNELVK